MMIEDTVSTPITAHGPVPSGLLRRVFRGIVRAICRSRQRRALAELDARLLRDIGRTAEEARREVSKPAWRR